MKFFNFINFSIPSASSIINDILKWNSGLSGYFSEYPFGKDELALHRNPLIWEPKNDEKFSTVYLDKEHSTFSFIKDEEETQLNLPCSSFIYDEKTSSFSFYSLSPETIKLADQLFEINGASFSVFYGDKKLTFQNKVTTSHLEISNSNLVFKTTDETKFCVLDSKKASFQEEETNSLIVSKDGFKMSEGEDLNLVVSPYRNIMSDMITNPSTSSSTVNEYLFNGNYEFSRNKETWQTAFFELNLGLEEKLKDGIYNGNIFSRNDDFSLPDNDTYQTIGFIKFNVRGASSNRTISHTGLKIFGGRILNSNPSFLDLQNTIVNFSSSNSIPGIESRFWGRRWNFDTASEIDWNGGGLSLYNIFKGKIMNQPNALDYFYFNFRSFSNRNFPIGHKINITIKAKKSGITTNILFVFSTFPFFSKNRITFLRENHSREWQKTNIKVNFNSSIFDSKLYSLTGLIKVGTPSPIAFDCQYTGIPPFFHALPNERKYFTIGDFSLPSLNKYKMSDVIPVLSFTTSKSYFTNNLSSLLLPQNIIHFNIQDGDDNSLISKFVIPYTDYSERADIRAIYPYNSFKKFKEVSSIFIFNLVPFNIAGSECDFSIENWYPSSSCFGNFGLVGNTCNIFLVSNIDFETAIPNYGLLLANSITTSLSSIVFHRWNDIGVNPYKARFQFNLEQDGVKHPVEGLIGQSTYFDNYKLAILDSTTYSVIIQSDPEIQTVPLKVIDLIKYAKDFNFVIDDDVSSPKLITITFTSTNVVTI